MWFPRSLSLLGMWAYGDSTRERAGSSTRLGTYPLGRTPSRPLGIGIDPPDEGSPWRWAGVESCGAVDRQSDGFVPGRVAPLVQFEMLPEAPALKALQEFATEVLLSPTAAGSRSRVALDRLWSRSAFSLPCSWA
jgi:hypothetical protein